MLLIFDVGNTTIGLGISDYKKVIKTFKLSTNLDKTADEYYLDIKRMINDYNIKDVIIASVVPGVTKVLYDLSCKFLKFEPMILEPGLKTGIKIRTDNPKEVGADLICDAAALIDSPVSNLIIDFGTATKYIYLKNNSINGVIITPGIKISIEALIGNTALLPNIDIVVPKKILGTNTIECMQSGVTYGVAAQVDGLIEMVKREVNEQFDVIITGGLASLIAPLLTHKTNKKPNLTYEGLINIFNRNVGV